MMNNIPYVWGVFTCLVVEAMPETKIEDLMMILMGSETAVK